MAMISLKEYAEAHGKAVRSVCALINRGRLNTAIKIGSYWAIDEDEPYPSDARIKSGKYTGFRKKSDQ